MSGGISTPPLTARQRWIAITLATVVAQLAYWPTLVGTVAPSEDIEPQLGMLAVGLALVPFALATLAFASRHANAAGATVRAMGLFLLVGIPLGVFVPVFGVAIGLAAGGVVALRGPDGVRTLRWRWIGVAGLAIYLLVLFELAPQLGLLTGATVPFALHGLIDQGAEGARAQAERSPR